MSRLADTARRLAARRARRPAPPWAPEPPAALPPAGIVHVPGRGEFMVRDSGGDGPTVLLLHGWMVSADINWWRMYEPLARRHRVIAVDHRGHGRGLRTYPPFRLADCSDDAAALLRHLDVRDAVVVGYSMGGPITQLMARDHGDVVTAIVLCATATDWSEPRMRLLWRSMAVLRLVLALFPDRTWRWALRKLGFPDSPETTWLVAELTRSSARDVAEAGRELGRYDARSWISRLEQPAAVVVTTRDRQVPPRKQRELAQALQADTFEVAGDHTAVGDLYEEFAPQLEAAIGSVLERAGASRAAAPEEAAA
jgi:3-oxoadipate enol-lactonase